jgi:pantetheine-phosphate adenylyltransferase
VITYEGLTIDLCHRIKADFILRGLRNPADFEFEKYRTHEQASVQNRNGVFNLRHVLRTLVPAS